MNVVPVRRFVTADDENGLSVAVEDCATDDTFRQGTRAVALTDLWRIESVPARVRADSAITSSFSLNPPGRGVVFRIVQFDPGSAQTDADGAALFAAMGAADDHAGDPTHPFMHRTNTVDFGIVISGSISMVLDRGRIEMVAGDVLVQRATNHEWRNEGDVPCLVAFVLIAGE